MKKLILISLAAATAISLAGCNTPQGQNMAGGAIIGGATGAAIGGLATGRASGAWTGAAIGAAGGALIGAAATPPAPRCASFYYDYYGNPVCRSYY
jgi:osmotically inducible lipoprotein OsmB